MFSSSSIVRSEVAETYFGLYSDIEKRDALSICKIISPVTLDLDGNPVDG
jgi:hypothetical protein